MTDDANQLDLSNDAVVRGTVDAIQAAMEKLGVPILDGSGEQVADNTKKKKKSKKNKKKGEELLQSLFGLKDK